MEHELQFLGGFIERLAIFLWFWMGSCDSQIYMSLAVFHDDSRRKVDLARG